MANIFKKANNLIKKKPTDDKAMTTETVDSKVSQDTPAAEDYTEGQRKRREDFIATISKGHEMPEEFKGITKASAKEELRSRIEKRIQSLESDFEEMQKIVEEREKARLEYAERSTKRRQRREQAKAEQAEDVVITENAIFAKFEEPKAKDTPSPSLEQVIPRDTVQLNILKQQIEEIEDQNQQEILEGQTEIPLEGQMAFKDFEEEQEKAIFDVPIVEFEKKPEELDFFDKGILAIKKFNRKVKELFITIPAKYIKKGISYLSNFLEKKNPEKFKELVAKLEKTNAKLIEKKNLFFKKAKETFIRFIEAEKRTSDKLAHLITRVDHKQDQNAKKAEKALKEGTIKAHRLRHWLDIHKRGVLMSFATGVAAAILVVSAINWLTAYEYSYNGKTLGTVKNQEDVLAILDVVSEQLSKEHNAEVYIDKNEDITFKKVWNLFGEIDTKEEVLRSLTYMQDMSVIGYAINVEGQNIAIVESEAAAKSILEEVKLAYTPASDTIKYEDVDFAESIDILQVETKLGKLYSHDDALYKILTGAEEKKVHIVQKGETFSTIAASYGISQADLQASNPTINPAKLSIGQEIILTQAVPLLTVQTVEICTYIEYIPYLTTYEESASMYQGETSTKRAGQYGERSVTSKVVRNNGLEVAKLELDSAITKQPVDAIIVKGTKALPAKKGTGKFIYPVTGYRLTSTFGQRWGRMHYGIDLACSTGTKIRAADGGTVKFSGYSGSYGYVVKIDHGGGYVTVYAHCSKLFVKVGESVYQGQHIANVGSTGRSTGPHCHFEVQYLGVQKNPLNYL